MASDQLTRKDVGKKGPGYCLLPSQSVEVRMLGLS